MKNIIKASLIHAIILSIIFVISCCEVSSISKNIKANLPESLTQVVSNSTSMIDSLKDSTASAIDSVVNEVRALPSIIVVPRQQQPGRAEPAPPPKPGPQPKITDNLEIRNAILASANRYRGARYQLGAQNPPSRFDCSGLIVQAYYEATGIVIPRTSAMMWAMGRRVNRESVQPGDIIVFGRGSPSHVAIYHDGTNMLHAASAGRQTGVILSRQDENYWAQRFMGYVTFVDTPINITRSAANQIASSEFPVELTNSPQTGGDPLPALVNTGINVIMYNDTGANGNFDVYFYRSGTSRTSGESDRVQIRSGEAKAGKVFVGTQTGRYDLTIVNREGNVLFEQTFSFEE